MGCILLVESLERMLVSPPANLGRNERQEEWSSGELSTSEPKLPNFSLPDNPSPSTLVPIIITSLLSLFSKAVKMYAASKMTGAVARMGMKQSGRFMSTSRSKLQCLPVLKRTIADPSALQLPSKAPFSVLPSSQPCAAACSLTTPAPNSPQP